MPDPSSGTGAVATAPQTSTAAAPVTRVTPTEVGLAAGEVFQYRLRVPADLHNISKLAGIIVKCLNKGTHKLEIRTREDHILEGWAQAAGLADVRVNGPSFKAVAEFVGL